MNIAEKLDWQLERLRKVREACAPLFGAQLASVIAVLPQIAELAAPPDLDPPAAGVGNSIPQLLADVETVVDEAIEKIQALAEDICQEAARIEPEIAAYITARLVEQETPA